MAETPRMNEGHQSVSLLLHKAFELFAQDKYLEGRQLISHAAIEHNSSYARVLIARAFYAGYWGWLKDTERCRIMLRTDDDSLLAKVMLLYLFNESEPEWLVQIAFSQDPLVLAIANLCNAMDGDELGAIHAPIEALANQGCQLSMAIAAQWSPVHCEQAAYRGFADAQFENGEYERASLQLYVPAMIRSSLVVDFIAGVRILLEHRRSNPYNIERVQNMWTKRFNHNSNERYILGKHAHCYKWRDRFLLVGADLYKESRDTHRRSVCALLCSAPLWGADKAFARQLARDVFAWMDRLASGWG